MSLVSERDIPQPKPERGNGQSGVRAAGWKAAKSEGSSQPQEDGSPAQGIRVAVLTGGKDADYALGLVQELAGQGAYVELVGNRLMADSPAVRESGVIMRDFLGRQNPDVSIVRKVGRLFSYYVRLLRWAASADVRILHILWYYRLPALEGTVLNSVFRLLGKRLIFTAHNVDDRARDDESSALHRFFLRRMYRRMDHILVHTEMMKEQLARQFGIDPAGLSVVPHGINDRIPSSGMTRQEARRRLGLEAGAKILLFFGNIAPYKGLELLAEAFRDLCREGVQDLCLIVAGRIKKSRYGEYWSRVESLLRDERTAPHVRLDLEFIPDEDVEAYFRACDVCVLPYREIYQSGVMILSYGFGLPVIATDVGSLSEEVEEGRTGWICRRDDPADLAEKVKAHFASDLYRALEERAGDIQSYAQEKYSWYANVTGTLPVYRRLGS